MISKKSSGAPGLPALLRCGGDVIHAHLDHTSRAAALFDLANA